MMNRLEGSGVSQNVMTFLVLVIGLVSGGARLNGQETDLPGSETGEITRTVEDDTSKVSVPPAAEPQGDSTVEASAGEVTTEVTTQEVQPPVPVNDGTAQGGTLEIANGTRVRIDEKGFSMIPPEGWEIRRDFPGVSLLVQIPKASAGRYQRTIQVMSFEGPRFIDEYTAKDFEELIVRNFSEASTGIEEYRIRQHLNVEMADGRAGILFYSEFNLEGVPLMQAHILVSSPTHHYLATYTDLAEHFEAKEPTQYLTEAWTSMTSLELNGRTPGRFEAIIFVGIGALGLILLGGIFLIVRKINARRQYEQLGHGESDFKDSPTTDSSISEFSNTEMSLDTRQQDSGEEQLIASKSSLSQSQFSSKLDTTKGSNLKSLPAKTRNQGTGLDVELEASVHESEWKLDDKAS